MGDLADLLQRTTPTVATPDLDQLVVAGATRHRRRRAAARVGAGLALAGALAGAGLSAQRTAAPTGLEVAQSPSTRATEQAAEGASPSAGDWQPVPTPPLPQAGRLSTFGATDDGRVVLWGPRHQQVRDDDTVDETLTLRGAVLDPRDQTWTEIPAPPGLGPDDEHVHTSMSGRWLTVWSSAPGGAAGASYDLHTGDWVPIPAIGSDADTRPLAQVGDTFLVAGVDRLHRWTADDGWTTSAPYPGGPHRGDTVLGGFTIDRSQTRIAFAPTPPPLADETGVAAPGAVYEVGTDTWTTLPPAPLEDGEVLTGGGFWRGDQLVTNARVPNTPSIRLLAYDTTTARWVAPSVDPLPEPTRRGRSVQVLAFPDAVTAQQFDGSGGTFHAWQLSPVGTWSPIELPHDADGRAVVVTTPDVTYLHELTAGAWRVRTRPRTGADAAPGP